MDSDSNSHHQNCRIGNRRVTGSRRRGETQNPGRGTSDQYQGQDSIEMRSNWDYRQAEQSDDSSYTPHQQPEGSGYVPYQQPQQPQYPTSFQSPPSVSMEELFENYYDSTFLSAPPELDRQTPISFSSTWNPFVATTQPPQVQNPQVDLSLGLGTPEVHPSSDRSSREVGSSSRQGTHSHPQQASHPSHSTPSQSRQSRRRRTPSIGDGPSGDWVTTGPMPGGPQNPEILIGFKTHVAKEVWDNEVISKTTCGNYISWYFTNYI